MSTHASDFKIGDVVQLKSGGPLMTVEKVEGGNVSTQYWDSERKAFLGRTFDFILLKKATDDAAGGIYLG